MGPPETTRAEGIRVVLGDDADDARTLLRSLLQRDGRFQVVGEAADWPAVIELTGEAKPDAVVVDLALTASAGAGAIDRLRAEAPATRVVVLAPGGGSRTSAATPAGAAAYLDKRTAIGELVEVLTALCGPVPATSDLDKILSFLSHELQNPVTVIQGLAATLRSSMDVMDEEVVRAAVEAIERNARNLGALVRSLGEAQALETGRLQIDRQPLDLATFVGDVVRDLALLTGDHPVKADLQDGVVIEGDPVLLRQVVTNLLSNAVKFSPSDAPIRVTLRSHGGAAEVTVEDEGPGVPRGREAELFAMFSRLDSPTKGTGLGLFISRGIALAHGGDVIHEHRPEGGARFRLRLPAGEAAAR